MVDLGNAPIDLQAQTVDDSTVRRLGIVKVDLVASVPLAFGAGPDRFEFALDLGPSRCVDVDSRQKPFEGVDIGLPVVCRLNEHRTPGLSEPPYCSTGDHDHVPP